MRFNDPTNPGAWLLGSVIAIVVATNLAWLVVHRKAAEPAFRYGPLAALGWLVISVFYLLVPFIALQRGVLSPYALGLTEIDWPVTLSNGMVLAGLIVAGLMFGWLVYRRARYEESPGGEGWAEPDVPAGPLPRALTRVLAVLHAPLDAALGQWHWAFYRAAVFGLLALPLSFPGVPLVDRALQGLQAEPLYWGAWAGIGVAGLEWALDPFGRAHMRRPGERETALRRAALAVATTGLFVLTRNFWLCLVVHVAVETLVAGWFRLALPSAAQVD
jgi:hypothetical protein